MPSVNELATIEQQVESDSKLFELAQRKASVYAKSTLVPDAYKNNVGNCLIAMNMAQRQNSDVLQVMQNLYIVHGKPSFSSKYLIGCFNACGKYEAISYEFTGEGEDYGCTAVTVEKRTGKTINGPKVTWKMVRAEGWFDRNGSKWKSMPQLMFMYRAAAFLINTHAPEISLGMNTDDELYDTIDGAVVSSEPAKLPVKRGKAESIVPAKEEVVA